MLTVDVMEQIFKEDRVLCPLLKVHNRREIDSNMSSNPNPNPHSGNLKHEITTHSCRLENAPTAYS